VDSGDQWSRYCILSLQGETISAGHLHTRHAEVAEFFEALTPARVVIEVGTHSAWVQEIIAGEGHEMLVANPRLMEGRKRRKRKSDRIDAHKLARLGRVDPQSLHPITHRSREVRQDLVLLRPRDATFTSPARRYPGVQARPKGDRDAVAGSLLKSRVRRFHRGCP
jgi:transposase